jgi:histidinol-phosphate aminotransferase
VLVTCIKMDSNENPFGPSPKAVQAMQEAVGACNRYPDNDARKLRHRVAELNRLPAEQVLIGAGSSDLLGIACRSLLKQGLDAVTSRLSFIVYSIATKAAGGRLIEIPPRNHGFDLEGILDAIGSDTRIVFLANPNNPTGSAIESDEVDHFLKRVPEYVTVVLDEAYYDFANYFAAQRGKHYSRSLDYVREGRRVIVLRTFSKAHGLAGIRVGYGFGPADLMASMGRMRTTFSISGPAQAGALAALEDEAHIQRVLENNAQETSLLREKVAELGYLVVETWANFLFCEVREDASALANRLRAEGIMIRPLGPWGAPTAIRITIGTAEQNRSFLTAFQKVVANASARQTNPER